DLAELPQDVQARLVGQAQVQENNVRPNVTGAFEALAARGGNLDPVCGRGEHLAHLVREQVRVVIDQEQVGHGSRASARWSDPDLRPSLYESVARWGLPCLPPTVGRSRTSPRSWTPKTSRTFGRPGTRRGSTTGNSTRSWASFRGRRTGPWPTSTGAPCSSAR